MIRDPFYRDIIARLNERLDPELFEQCAADLLREVYPGLAPIRGGADSGMDGAIADGEGEPFPLVSTTAVCPARSLDRMRLKREYKEPMAAGRLLLMSPFGEKVRRLTADTALTRNRFVAALADTVLIAHAQPGSKTEQLAQEVVGWGKQVYTLDHPANERLLALGVLRYLSAGMPFVRPGHLLTR